MPISLRFIELMQAADNTEYFKENHISAEEIGLRLAANGWRKIKGETFSILKNATRYQSLIMGR